MSKIKVGDHVQLVSTSWTQRNFGITDCMPCSGKFVVEEIDGFKVTLENLCNSWHINDFRLLKYPANHLDHIHKLKRHNRKLSMQRNNLYSRMCDPSNAMTFSDDVKKLNKISEKIGSNGLKIRSLRHKIKYGE